MSSMIDDLLRPEALPDPTKTVSLVQTHISMVFIADGYVYKIKKGVDFGFLDFSSLEKREFYCHQEIKLNKRLSDGIYLGVLPVTHDGSHYKIGEGAGEIVDYAVKMKKIPQNTLMRALFEKGELKLEHLKDIAEVIGRFHLRADRSPEIDVFGRPEKVKINTDENFEQTEKYIDLTIDGQDYETLQKWTDRFFRENGSLFIKRVEDGKIRDIHGDLHMEHVVLSRPISIIDCIEFNDRFRYMDTLVDIGFLLMDLDYREGWELARELWESYYEVTGESGVDDLLIFYKVYRAYIRGKVNSFQLDDPNIADEDKRVISETASKYFKLARSYIR